MSYLLDEIFNTASVHDESGKKFDLHSHTSREQCTFLDEVIRAVRPKQSLEVGLAYGISTLQILKSMAVMGQDFIHTVIDPFQSEWNNIGKLNITRSGYESHVKFFPEFSSAVLPKLHSEGTRIQFAYIDSTKVFDQLMVDAHYINSMMDVGGVLVLDDCDYSSIRLLARFLSHHPSFQVYKGFSPDPVTLNSRIASATVAAWFALMPFGERKLSRIDKATDAALGINYKCIAFKKIADDTRPWNWHHAF